LEYLRDNDCPEVSFANLPPWPGNR
jgi:hypothetical protein